jgi:CSLREA domain-containing protein
MRHSHPLPRLLALLVLAACGEDQSPTAPTPPAEPGGPAYSHTAGHKVVNSLADPGNGTCNATQCTLREAIKDPGSTEISFKPGLTGTITLARPGLGGGTLVIEKTLAITGPGTGIVIRRRSTDPAFRIFRIGAGVSVKLTNLTLRNGKTDQTGGGLINFGRLALTTCTVAGNSATLGGGGIDNHGRVVLTNSRVRNNSARPLGGGGGINNLGNLTLANSLVTGNSASREGGGIFNGDFPFTDIVGQITNSTVARNSAVEGGGIANFRFGRFTITKSTIAGNSARTGGGIFNEAFGRFGGASVTLRNSTVSGNSANLGGGGIVNGGDVELDAFGVITLTNSTVARNSAPQGGGIVQGIGGVATLVNSLVAENNAPEGPDVVLAGGSVSARFNLIGNGSGSGITNTNGNQVGTASAPIDPKLGALADNGGPTRTHALLLGSPAIDAASTPDCPTTDQRGVLRPQGAACDIGSYERK